jgi:predicted O-methyltransferase YrrM
MMIDLSTPNEWQHIDPETGLLFPWYVKSFLDELATWDLKGKIVFEYGCGASTLWWRKKAKSVYSMDENKEYAEAVTGVHLAANPVDYVNWIYETPSPDIVVIDGERLREECVQPALACLRQGGKLIYDNWMQPSVEVQSEETQKILLSLPHFIYKQYGHPDWQTAVFIKP